MKRAGGDILVGVMRCAGRPGMGRIVWVFIRHFKNI